MLNPASTHYDRLPSGGQLAFLRRVARDEDFRAALEADPGAALAEYGLEVDAKDVPRNVRLPKEEAILDILIYSGDDQSRQDTGWFGLLGS